MLWVSKNGKTLSLGDAALPDGRRAIEVDRDELEVELLRLGLNIERGSGLDGMATEYGWWLKELQHG